MQEIPPMNDQRARSDRQMTILCVVLIVTILTIKASIGWPS